MTAHSFHLTSLDSLTFGQQQSLEEDLRLSSYFLVELKLASLLLLEFDIDNVSLSIRLLTVDDTNGVAVLQRTLSLWSPPCIFLRVS